MFVTKYISTVTPADRGTGAVDNGMGWWYTINPQAAIGTYSWSVQAQGVMCDATTFANAFQVLPPWPTGVVMTSTTGGTQYYSDDTSAKLSWNAISLPADAYYELTLVGPTGSVVKNLGTATSYSLAFPIFGTGNYTYSLHTKSGAYASAKTITGAFTVLDPARRRACC